MCVAIFSILNYLVILDESSPSRLDVLTKKLLGMRFSPSQTIGVWTNPGNPSQPLSKSNVPPASKDPWNKSLRLQMPSLPLGSEAFPHHLLLIFSPDPGGCQAGADYEMPHRSPQRRHDLWMRYPNSEPAGWHALGLAQEVESGEDDDKACGVGRVLNIFVPVYVAEMS
jgi:hypothetical protein